MEIRFWLRLCQTAPAGGRRPLQVLLAGCPHDDGRRDGRADGGPPGVVVVSALRGHTTTHTRTSRRPSHGARSPPSLPPSRLPACFGPPVVVKGRFEFTIVHIRGPPGFGTDLATITGSATVTCSLDQRLTKKTRRKCPSKPSATMIQRNIYECF